MYFSDASTLPHFRMLFQSTHEDRQGAEAPAEPGERIAESPLQRTLTTHIMGRWAKHEGALAHVSLKRSVEMLELQCAQRFPVVLVIKKNRTSRPRMD